MEKINGRTPEEIKAGLRFCTTGKMPGYGCNVSCPYLSTPNCWLPVKSDALALIERLEAECDAALAKVPKWIGVEERLPEDGELVLCILYGDVNGCRVYEGAYELAMHFNACEDDGEFFEEEWEMWDCKRGEVSNIKVTHWMPLPEPPEVSE